MANGWEGNLPAVYGVPQDEHGAQHYTKESSQCLGNDDDAEQGRVAVQVAARAVESSRASDGLWLCRVGEARLSLSLPLGTQGRS